MGLREVFKHVKTGRKVVYKDVCKFESIIEEDSEKWGIDFTSTEEDIRTCILCEDFDTHEIYVIPIVQFLNYYEPCANIVDDAMTAFKNIKTADDERYKENIHTLYSGKPEANLAGPSKGV